MTQYNILNVKLSNSQLHKLKSVIKDGTKVTSKISSNVVGDFNDENNFPHKLLLTNTRFSKLCKAFANGLSANIGEEMTIFERKEHFSKVFASLIKLIFNLKSSF